MTPLKFTVEISGNPFPVVIALANLLKNSDLTVTQKFDETKPVTSSPPQTDCPACTDARIRDFIVECFACIYTRADPGRFRDAIDKGIARRADARIAGDQAERLRCVGAHVCPSEEERAASATADGWAKFRASEAEREATRCAPSADSKSPPSHAWKPGEHTEAAAEDRRNNHSDSDVDDSAYQ